MIFFLCMSGYDARRQYDDDRPDGCRDDIAHRLVLDAERYSEIVNRNDPTKEPITPVSMYRNKPSPPTTKLASQPATRPIRSAIRIFLKSIPLSVGRMIRCRRMR
jgi:hypothetical protein